jgi:hypothetical protein
LIVFFRDGIRGWRLDGTGHGAGLY